MADTTQPPINGTYAAPHPYPDPYVSHTPVNTVNNTMGSNYHPASTSTPSNGPAGSEPKNEIPKDEVGWYFVEQYYTTMSRNPDRLHLFYSRHSHFVFGTEAESVPVAVGQKAINEKIRALDFHDCKVRVLNVDTQGSMDNILVAVIGEISNRSEPSRKFSQTFVLAQQPNGYYVLNDIFRYLADEVEEFVVDETAAAQPESVSELQGTSVAQQETASEPEQPITAQRADEGTVSEADAKLAAPPTNGEVDNAASDAPQAAAQEKPAVSVTPAVPAAPAEPEALQPEKPQTPEPSPVASTPKDSAPAAKKEPVVPTKAVPMSWANVASKNRAAAAAAAAATAAAPTAPAKSAATATAAAPAPSTAPTQTQPEQPAAAVPAEASTSSQQSSTDGSGWQTAGHDHGKKQSRAGDDNKHPAYIKNVNEKVDASLLKTVLSRFGKLTHFDVNRSRSCAFVDFADQASYNAAVAANPHQIGSEQVTVEERRVRTGNFSNGFANARGGANRGRSDGRAGSQGRGGNYQREQGRGGFSSRGGRGGNVNKGRSQAQAA
ncbi:Putative G3BP-like protein [Talaromyces islandicus]|uniref:Putative G3BP-like protein n=1 Tax=Talaromyces islandicus TaxID=28573 RepID=A0A0U1LTD8_TALIS|nr:Putative G3BP-like protein [Talaromyces islandicus]